jgi:hypothetical protein
MNLILRSLSAFGRFWYDFVIGDDWTIAATVAASFVVTWVLQTWWLVPIAAAAVVGLSLRRTRPPS